MDLNAWKAAMEDEGLLGRRGSLHDHRPLLNMEVVEYLQGSGWTQAANDGSVQVWHLGLAPVHLQIRRDEAGLIDAIRLSDETGEPGAPAVFLTELDLGFSMRELAEPFEEQAVEDFLADVYREMTGQDGRAESLI